MWKCTKCSFINNNSSLTCHGLNCNANRQYDAELQPTSIIKSFEKKKVYDFCPKCLKDRYWLAARYKGKKAWRCTVCNSLAFLIGKPKPFPMEEKVEPAA